MRNRVVTRISLARASMMLFLLALLLFPLCGMALTTPTTLHIVDLRGITGQPEIETWLGSLQGLLNRQDTPAGVFIIRSAGDAELAQALLNMYHLQKDTFSPRGLLAFAKPQLTGEVLYDPAKPYQRNLALTAAAVADGNVIATDTDLGLPVKLDLRARADDRVAGYKWAIAQFGAQADADTLALAPESGNLLADKITAQKLLAVDLNPNDAAEKALLAQTIATLPDAGRLLGDVDNRCGNRDAALWSLTTIFGNKDRTLVPARAAGNLSLFARLPITRPLMQGRFGAQDAAAEKQNLVLIYDGGAAALSGSQSLDYAMNFLPTLIQDAAEVKLPIGIEVPLAVKEYAPALYQLLVARQRFSRTELIAAPNGDGWALPMAMGDPTSYLRRSSTAAQSMDISGLSLWDIGGKIVYMRTLGMLAALGWRDVLTYPITTGNLADKQPRQSVDAPGNIPIFVGMVAPTRVSTVADLRKALRAMTYKQQVYQKSFDVLYIDPLGIPPAELHSMMTEITDTFNVLTPAQATRAKIENDTSGLWLEAKVAAGINSPTRDNPTLTVSTPITTLAHPTAADAIPIAVRISGRANVLLARVSYATPGGQLGVADLKPVEGDTLWTATLPPMLTGGQLVVSARVVESGGMENNGGHMNFWGYGISTSNEAKIDIPVVDSDNDGADDTLEWYQGTDPTNWDTWGCGLADGYNPTPWHARRDQAPLLSPIYPPADKSFLIAAGASTTDKPGRTIPAGGSVTYHIPLVDTAQAPAGLYLSVLGSGTVSLNTDVQAPLSNDTPAPIIFEIPVSSEQMGKAELTLKIIAGDHPLTLYALSLSSNPQGPYFLPTTLSPAHPPANYPITVSAVIYAQHSGRTDRPPYLKSVHLFYGPDTGHLKMAVMGVIEDTCGMQIQGEIPPQANGTTLVYSLTAEDKAGNIAVTPFNAISVGLLHRHSVSLMVPRDLKEGENNWNSTPIWADYGRSLTSGQGVDHIYFRGRPGRYTVWLLTQARERGIHVVTTHVENGFGATDTVIDSAIPAGSADGWYKVGVLRITNEDPTGFTTDISPIGEKGFCAYGEMICLQDDQFQPPLQNATLEYYNGLFVTGVSDWQTVSGVLKIKILQSGNLDKVDAYAKQTRAAGGHFDFEPHPLTKNRDGSWSLDTRVFGSGDYAAITIAGLKDFSDKDGTHWVPLVTTTINLHIR